jgi:hypothetical protein
LYHVVGGWGVVADLVRAALDQDSVIAELGWTYLNIWRTKSIRLFSKLTKQDLQRFRDVYELAQKLLYDIKADQQSLLKEIASIFGIV